MIRQDASRQSPRVNSPDRTQADPYPKTIDELIPPDHKARTIWKLVEELDVTPLYDQIKSVEGHAGRPAIDPKILVTLWLYATVVGIASAHVLARLCRESDPFKWICGGVDVNYHTLSDFRTKHGQWLREQVVANIASMRAEGLVNLDAIGQDGMRVRASAGNDSFKKAETLQQLLEEAEQQWDDLQRKFEEEEFSAGRRAAKERAVAEKIDRLGQAQRELEQLAEQRESRKKGDGATTRASTTDPQARRMKMGDGGTRPAYNVQFATDLKSLVIIGMDVVQVGSDAGQMEPMVERIEKEQAPLSPGAEMFVDGGFATKSDIETVGERGVIVFAPVKEVEKQMQQGKDPYAPKRGDTPHVAAWRQRMGTPEGKTKYKQRSKTEWPNAEARNRGLYQFLVRGLQKVKTVVLWYVLTHNLFRMVALRAARATAAA